MSLTWYQCDQIGRFFKVLGYKFITKVAKIVGNFLVQFVNITFEVNIDMAIWGNWVTFLSFV